MRSSFILALLLAGPVAADEPGPTRDAFVAVTDPLGEPVDKVVYLDQGWSPAVSLKFYFTSQGSQIIPYDWFLALEQVDSQTLFRDNQNILKYRYLPQLPDSNNPDGLPVGFVGDEGVRSQVAGADVRGLPYERDSFRNDRLSRRRCSHPGRRPGSALRDDHRDAKDQG
jgi:hypothetical protein